LSFCSVENVKKWSPRIAVIILILMSLLIFWGVVNIFFRFLDADSYFSVSPSNDVASSDAGKERNQKMKDFLRKRGEKRQEVSAYPTIGNGEKDPFSLP